MRFVNSFVARHDAPSIFAARAAFARAVERYGAGAPELTVAKRIKDDAGLSFRLDGDWPAPWDVDETSPIGSAQ